MLIKQIIESELRGLGLLVVHVILKPVIFVTKQSFLRQIFKRIITYCGRLCTLFPFTWTKLITKFIQKMLTVKNEL